LRSSTASVQLLTSPLPVANTMRIPGASVNGLRAACASIASGTSCPRWRSRAAVLSRISISSSTSTWRMRRAGRARVQGLPISSTPGSSRPPCTIAFSV
jgi:hypothetical protein